ncbi:MAG: TonB-dependent receptor, partial [Gemmatimonadetes bacterium]|nr:TonB-dependent receptor [Gemmatimonadota bacterium]
MSKLSRVHRAQTGRVMARVVGPVLAVLLCVPVYAQEPELEEILVTARKRSESVQDIPESITVFSESQVEDAGITRIKDVADLTPNLVLRQSYRMGVVNLSARGLAAPQQGDSPVVVNFDGVQAPAQDFINQDLFDIDRIAVLKAPQGALYGAGAIGGAINVVT